MKVIYEFKKHPTFMQAIIKTIDLGDFNFSVSQTFENKDIVRLGNLIDRKAFPFKWCYVLYNQFKEKVNKIIVLASAIITDEKLKNDLINYSKALMKSEVELSNMDDFMKFVQEVQEYCDSIE